MNSPYGNVDYPSDFSGFEISRNSDPSTDEDFDSDNNGFSTYANGDFEPLRTIWPPTSVPLALNPPSASPYNFYRGPQVWSILDMHFDQSPVPALVTSAPGHYDTRCINLSHDGAIAPTPPPPANSTGEATEQTCNYPTNTAAEVRVAPEQLHAHFPKPTLPRKDPPCLCDDDGQLLQKQNPRFDGDLYASLWIRGEGVSREGWCGFCASWHRLKDSAYWYHLHYTHGIACHSGRQLDPPRELRWSRETNAYDALCAYCNEWVAIGKGVKVRTAYWRHAYKCSTKGMGKAQIRSPHRTVAVPATARP